MRAPAAAIGENTEVRLVSLDDARERARVTCVAMKQNLANTPVLLLSEIVDEWFVLNAPRLSRVYFFFHFSSRREPRLLSQCQSVNILHVIVHLG